MVMATDVLDAGRATGLEGQAGMDAMTLHERLVAHVRAVSGEEDPRCSVWGEHSYARPRGPPPAAHVRVLLQARAHSPPARLDVLTPPACVPEPPADRAAPEGDHNDEEEEVGVCACDPRCSVCGEHSYARPRGPPPAAHVRVLLQARAHSPPARLDVLTPHACVPEPPADRAAPEGDHNDEEEEDPRCSVWGEHSYARPRGPPPAAHVRVLLQARAHSPPARLDVLTTHACVPEPPADRAAPEGDHNDEEEEDPRCIVWGEHSYARPRGPPPAAHVRVLLQARAHSPPARLDVLTPPACVPEPPADRAAPEGDHNDEEEEVGVCACAGPALRPPTARRPRGTTTTRRRWVCVRVQDPRCIVWGEHSYARPRGPPPAAHVRVLLQARAHSPPARLDVLTPPACVPEPPADRAAPEGDHNDEEEEGSQVSEDDDEEWEERLCAQAPGAAHARLARDIVGALRDLRLERAARAGAAGRWARREGARAAARRLRRALAPHWGGAAAWALNALPARLPRELRALLRESTRELRRAAPHLAARLPPLPAAEDDPLDAVGPMRAAAAPGAWLAWVPSGCDALDERWTRRLGALLHVRRLARAAPAPAAPDRWCAALAHEARAALADVLEEAGSRAVVLCGLGAGAALATWLAAGAGGVRALLLLAPPLLTAEGARHILEEVEVPLLAVVGGGGAQCWRGAAADVAARDAGDAGSGSSDTLSAETRARRVLLLAGADDALRLPRRHRARLGLPQQALDAAIAEECARWATDVADPARADVLLAARTPSPPRAEPARDPRTGGDVAADEARACGGNRAIEIVEGRVVSRGTGATPLLLPPPRRAAPALAAADIMQLPIVFADDESPAAPAPPDAASGALTVTSGNPRRAPGAVKYTRVIVAKRAPPAHAAPRRGPGRPRRRLD
ncbi:uncharacterized protein LOC123873468 [Maniola jurtina]|uniref:uncharacterized protein LOC123873468 n=1 Tax=Maniola jurtina TaxID=191418 RepID=UPI001E68AE11|nr:uncharacterized protein LOC123873468 [Maniola jurtina]